MVDDLEVYVIRVYRNDSTGFAGVVERVSGGEEKSFRGSAELCRALADFLSFDAFPTSDQESER